MIRRSVIALASGLALAACATAPAPVALWKGFEDHPKGYLEDAAGLNAAKFLPPAPAAGSEREAADIAVYRKTRGLEGSPRWRLAAQDAEVETPDAPFKAFQCALGVRVDPVKAPSLTILLGRILPDVETIQAQIKSTVRPRPYIREPAALCVSGAALSRSSSYPSGHSAIGFSWALILAEIDPARRDAILRRGVAYGESRAVCGFHYVSDVDAGRVMGAGLVAALHDEPAFAGDLAAARQELAAIRKAGPPPRAFCEAEASTLSQAAY